MPEYYTTKEVADKFRVSMQAIRNMIDRHEIKAVKIGRAYRIPVSEIERITTLEDFATDSMPIKGESIPTTAPLRKSCKK